ncbi:MAG: GWxTD domain-containing protein [Acidobacteria bacterium]|nr:GWxTD domain-containing protein [Acidobacteriota bacterium]
MKSSSTCCAVAERFLLALLLGLVLLPVGPAQGAKRKAKKDLDPAFLIQPFLSPEYAQWLIGPVARIATEDEIETYLRLQDDEAAKGFIEEFWARRDPFPAEAGNPVRDLYEERATEVDNLYGENLYRGRHTDRGTIYVLYGPPEETDREVAPYYGGEAIEVWRYPKGSEKGLDGQQPERSYRFMRDGDRTIFYNEALISRKKKAADRIPRPDRGF